MVSASKAIVSSGLDQQAAFADRVHVQNVAELSLEPRWLINHGLLPGWSAQTVFGNNDAITTDYSDLWECSVAPSRSDFVSASSLYISSDSASDRQQVRIHGLSDTSGLQTAYVTMSGQTKVAVSGSWLEAWKIYNVDSSGVVGNVYVYTNATPTAGVPPSGSIKLYMNATHQYGRIPYFMIPKNTAGCLDSVSIFGAGNKNVSITVDIKEPGGVWYSAYDIQMLNQTQQIIFAAPAHIPEGTRIRVKGKVDTGTASISAGFSIILRNI